MPSTDSISVYTEGTFEDHILELVNYVASGTPEDRAAFIEKYRDTLQTTEDETPLAEDAERQRQILSSVISEINGIGSGSDSEVEGFFNLLYSHLFSLFPDESDARSLLIPLLQAIVTSPPKNVLLKHRILSNLFNAVPRQSSLRLPIFNALLDVAVKEDGLNSFKPLPSQLTKWLSEWNVTPEDKSELLKTLHEVYSTSSDHATAYQFLLAYTKSLATDSADAQKAAIDCIATSLRLPNVFDFDPLLKLEVVVAAKNHELFSLLQIFLNQGLSEFNSWESSHSNVLGAHDLEKSQLERKIRLLTLSSLAFQYLGKDLPYTQIASALQIQTSEVEKWAIDAIRAGLIAGKLSQVSQSLHVTRSTARRFEREQWEALEKKLLSWRTGLAGVLEVVVAARKQTAASHISQAVQTQTVPA